MKTFTTLILAGIIFTVSIVTASPLANDTPLVGIKEGNWIEYNINVTGTGTPPPTHDVRWFRMQVLQVQNTAFSVNLTARYTNGTLGSAIWKFNFTDGNIEGWMIIPSNLNPGDTFYDSSRLTGKPVNVTIQGQEQRMLLGASRTVTYGNDSFRHKEWDKTTGVFIGSSEHLKNVTNKDGWYIEDLTVNIQATGTNMWKPQTLGLDQIMVNTLVAVSTASVILLSSIVVIARRKWIRKPTFSNSSQKKIVILTVLIVILVEIGSTFFFPFYDVGLSFAQINLIMQTIWTALVYASIWFRMKGNYFVHEITMLIVICAWAVGFVEVLFMDPFSSSTQIFTNSPLRLIMNSLHGIFSIPALIFGVWLVILWRPGLESFPTKSKRIAQLVAVCWIPSYIVGILDFMVLHTTFFG